MSNTLDETIKEKLGQVIDDLCNMEMPGRYHNQDWAGYALLQLIREARISQIRKMDRHIKDVWGVNNNNDYFIAEIKLIKENK